MSDEPPFERETAPTPPKESGLELVLYRAPEGELAAYTTPARDDGVRRPAIIWLKGGFGGIGSWLWEEANAENDQSVRPFLAHADRLVLFVPSFRGENHNPGRYEMFLGEVDDIRAAIDHVAARPDVDPNRIYVAGHSTGGTLALLLAAADSRPAGIVSYGGAPDLARVMAAGGFGSEPFDRQDAREVSMRSPLTFATAIATPLVYIEGVESFYPDDARRLRQAAGEPPARFDVVIVPDADHFSILRPSNDLLAAHIAAGKPGLPSNQQFLKALRTVQEKAAAELEVRLRAAASDEAVAAYRASPIVLTPAAAAAVREVIGEEKLGPETAIFVSFRREGAHLSEVLDLQEQVRAEETIVTESHGVRIAADRAYAGLLRGVEIDFNGQGLLLRQQEE